MRAVIFFVMVAILLHDVLHASDDGMGLVLILLLMAALVAIGKRKDVGNA